MNSADVKYRKISNCWRRTYFVSSSSLRAVDSRLREYSGVVDSAQRYGNQLRDDAATPRPALHYLHMHACVCVCLWCAHVPVVNNINSWKHPALVTRNKLCTRSVHTRRSNFERTLYKIDILCIFRLLILFVGALGHLTQNI